MPRIESLKRDIEVVIRWDEERNNGGDGNKYRLWQVPFAATEFGNGLCHVRDHSNGKQDCDKCYEPIVFEERREKNNILSDDELIVHKLLYGHRVERDHHNGVINEPGPSGDLARRTLVVAIHQIRDLVQYMHRSPEKEEREQINKMVDAKINNAHRYQNRREQYKRPLLAEPGIEHRAGVGGIHVRAADQERDRAVHNIAAHFGINAE